MMRCPRCGGLLFPAEDDELVCLICGERAHVDQEAFRARVAKVLREDGKRRERSTAHLRKSVNQAAPSRP